MVRILVLYYSRTGNTASMAQAVAEGASKEGAEVVLKRADYANVIDVSIADAVAFGSPCHFAYMAGTLKEFFDRMLPLTKDLMEKIQKTPAAAFVCNGESNGAEETLLSLEKMLFFYFCFLNVTKGVVSLGKPSEKILDECRALGQRLAQAALERTK